MNFCWSLLYEKRGLRKEEGVKSSLGKRKEEEEEEEKQWLMMIHIEEKKRGRGSIYPSESTFY